ncbi:hypothetical protein AB205_0092500, partial [Aquarana catesbeiana]
MRNLFEGKKPLYRNKPARKASLKKLLQFVKTQVPDADIGFVENKIGSLRSTYRKELNKVQASMRSGAAAEDVYVPSLWYYNRMRFLEDQMEARESLSTLPSALPSTLPSTPAEASEDQPGPSILGEVEEPSWSQEDLSQDKTLECGSQEKVGKGLSGQISDNMYLCVLTHPPPPPSTSPPPEPHPPRKAAGKAAGKRGGKAARKTRK